MCRDSLQKVSLEYEELKAGFKKIQKRNVKLKNRWDKMKKMNKKLEDKWNEVIQLVKATDMKLNILRWDAFVMIMSLVKCLLLQGGFWKTNKKET